MVKVRTKTKLMASVKLPVSVLQRDIDEGKCGLATKCMEKLAITRALIEHLNIKPEKVHLLHVRVDAGHINFNYDGYHWTADTPRTARNALIKFDRDKTSVGPHRYTIVAHRMSKIVKMTEERKQQINAARAQRVREGRPDKEYRDPTMHRRVVGYALERNHI